MKSIIIGAGELGRNLVDVMLRSGHDVVLVDIKDDVLKNMRAQYDIMTVCGSGASIKVLKDAGIENANHILCVSSNDSANLLASEIAHRFDVKTIICRLHGLEFFSPDDGITPELYGITKIVDVEKDCAERVFQTLDNRYVLEKLLFSNPNAVLTSIKILPDSPISGFPLRLIHEPERLAHIRLAGVIRNHTMLIPHGDTTIYPGDELYIAGSRTAVADAINWITPHFSTSKRFVIAGATRIGILLAEKLSQTGATVRVIEPDDRLSEQLLNMEHISVTVLSGSPTDKIILEEAGVGECDVFVSVRNDDEENILAGILAKRLGAKKVTVVTTKSEYGDVVPEIDGIDTGFNSCLESVNVILQSLPHEGSDNVGAVLQRTQAYVHEFHVAATSMVCNKRIADFHNVISQNVPVLALVFRDTEVLTPVGDLVLLENDVVVAIATRENIHTLQELFRPKKSLFGG